jgi:hypothetical protein
VWHRREFWEGFVFTLNGRFESIKWPGCFSLKIHEIRPLHGGPRACLNHQAQSAYPVAYSKRYLIRGQHRGKVPIISALIYLTGHVDTALDHTAAPSLQNSHSLAAHKCCRRACVACMSWRDETNSMNLVWAPWIRRPRSSFSTTLSVSRRLTSSETSVVTFYI